MVSNYALHEPAKMLAIEAVDVETAASLVGFQVSDRFSTPKVDRHPVLNCDVRSGFPLAVEQCDFFVTRLRQRDERNQR